MSDLADRLEQYPAKQDTMFPTQQYVEHRLTVQERDEIVAALRATSGVGLIERKAESYAYANGFGLAASTAINLVDTIYEQALSLRLKEGEALAAKLLEKAKDLVDINGTWMLRWDYWRKAHAQGYGGTSTRDSFESLLHDVADDYEQAAAALRATSAAPGSDGEGK